LFNFFQLPGKDITKVKDFHLIDSVSLVHRNKVKVKVQYCLDSIDEFSCTIESIHPTDRLKINIGNDKWFEEVVAKIQHESPIGKVAVFRCSFGGYHAANFAFRHPEKSKPPLLTHEARHFDIRDQLTAFTMTRCILIIQSIICQEHAESRAINMKIVLGTSEH